jgi:hypothetical protein
MGVSCYRIMGDCYRIYGCGIGNLRLLVVILIHVRVKLFNLLLTSIDKDYQATLGKVLLIILNIQYL